MAAEPWPTPEPIRARIALHAGEGELREGDYYGSPVNRCARIRSLAGPAQILLSADMADAVRQGLPAGTELRDLGVQKLKDIAEPEHIFELAWTTDRARG
jgi:class 3 adenylate cyclase